MITMLKCFWTLISSEAQGFFKGLWYNRGNFSYAQLKDISMDDFIIEDELLSVFNTLRATIGANPFKTAGISEKIIKYDELHSAVKILPRLGKSEVIFIKPTQVEAWLIPLVREAIVADSQVGFIWKVDYLKVIEG